MVIALAPILRIKIEILRRTQGDALGEILDGLRLEELERAQGYKYSIYTFRTSGECLEVESPRFRVWCRDLSPHLEPGVIGPTVFEVEGLLKRLHYVDSIKLRSWIERLLELDRELSDVESTIVKLITLEDKPKEAVKDVVDIVCVGELRTIDSGRLAPLPTYAFECAKTLKSTFNVKKWLGYLYIMAGGRWIGEPDSMDFLQAVMVRTFEALNLHLFNWKYSAFEKEVLNVLRAKAERAEPVKGVRSGSYLIFWIDTSYELREYRGEFVVHDINAKVRPELLKQAKAKGYNTKQLATAEAPVLVEILKSWVGDPYWVTLLELIGYTTIPFRYPFNKAFMLLGSGSNGKSTFIRMLKDILGRHNVTSIPLQAFTSLDYRFLWSGLVGKLANIFADIPKTPLKYTGVFKILTGEDCINIDRKGKEPIQCYINYAKLIFSANELPETGDTTRAFFRRWVLIDFPYTFPDDPTWYDRNIRPELRDTALTISLEAMREVLERKAFTGEADVRERWLEESDQIYRFIRDLERLNLARRDPNGRVGVKEFYRIYTRWAELQGVSILAKAEFTKELDKYGIVKGSKPYYTGIMLLERPDIVLSKLETLGEESREGLEAYQ